MKIGVVGGGVVGHATARCFVEHVDEVRVYDVVKERRTHPLDDVLRCDIVFVCLPSPQKKSGNGLDTTAIDVFFYEVAGTRTNYVLRSTVPIGTTHRLAEQHHLPNIVHSPEFLTARCAVLDAQIPARNVIGCPDPATCNPNDPQQAAGRLLALYAKRFPGVKTYPMTSDESEAVKLFQNSFFAVKVSLFNELRLLADRLGLDWDVVREAMMADGRIHPSHTLVPGPDGQRGFGGSCLPKDLSEMIRALGTQQSMVTFGAAERNRLFDRGY